MMTAADSLNKASVRYAAILLTGAVLILLAGCTQFAYNRLDTIARWYIDGLVTLDDDQQSRLRAWLAGTLDWHRHSELDRYSRFLRDLADDVAVSADAVTFQRAAEQINVFWKDLLGQVAPDGAHLLASLRPEQLDELLAGLEEEDAERLKEMRRRSETERIERRARSMERSVDRWTGSLSDEQKQIIARYAAKFPDDDEEWLASRRAWRARLHSATGPEHVEVLLRNPDRTWTDAYRAQMSERRQRLIGMLAELDGTLSARQREHARKRLVDLAGTLDSLKEK